MTITQMINRNGNPAANQFIIETDLAHYFQSYETVIAKVTKDGCKLTLGDKWNYSNTTTKHLRIFMANYCFYHGYYTKDIRKTISSGKIVVESDLIIE